MKLRIILGICFLLSSGYGQNDEASTTEWSNRIANYTISCDFDATTKVIAGTASLEWTNAASLDAEEIQLHLYLNAFANPQSTFLTEYGEVPAGLVGNWGYCRIKQILLHKTDLTHALRFIQPDDDNVNDSTVAALALPKPVRPGETIELSIKFETKLPALIERAGFVGDFHMVCQWFPKVGVFTDAGWNCHQYHANSEFFADFGTYDVHLTLPDDFIVGATGVLVDEKREGETRKLHYHAEDVHDFAWGASRNFIERQEQADELQIRLLVQAEHKHEIAERILRAVKTGLRYYQQRYGEYPYTQLTVLDSPVFSAVMEYPMLFLTGNFDGFSNPPAPNEPQPEDNRFPERLTLHELGHQWFYGMSANNEFEEAWLDEGLTEYITAKAFEAEYGTQMQFDHDGNSIAVRDFRKTLFLESYKGVPPLNNSWTYPTFKDYYVASYVKPKLMLYTLDNVLGEQKIETVIRTFFQKWRFKHPSSEDFIQVVAEVTGEEYIPFLRQYLGTSAYLDFSWALLQPNEIKISRTGTLVFPTEIEFRFEDGERLLEKWNAENAFKIYDFKNRPPLIGLSIDPDNKIEFEIDKQNNSM